MKKRGQAEMPYHWVFVMVAGAIILAFFAMFTVKYIDLQNRKENIEVGRMLSQNFELVESTEGLYCDTTISSTCGSLVFVKELDFFCIPSGENEHKVWGAYITVGDDPLSQQSMKDKIIFMPDSMRTRDLLIWTQPWNWPYKIANILYISYPQRRYYFVNPPDEIKELDIPPIFDIKKIATIKKADPEKDKVVFFNDKSSARKLSEDYEKLDVLNIDIANKKLTFFKDGESEDTFYVGEPLMLGAIFSSSYGSYQCGLARALDRMTIISEIYSRRTGYLAQVNPGCNYMLTRESLDELADISLEKLEEGDGISVAGLENLRDSLENQNENLFGQACLPVF